MRIQVAPVDFQIVETEMAATTGGIVPAKTLSIIDASGITVEVTFGATDWAAFQRYVADPVAETERQEARAKLMLAQPGMAIPKTRGKIH